MFGKNIFVLAFIFAVFLAGCINLTPDTKPTQQYLCDDGKTIVSKLSDCPPTPPVDTAYLECEQAPSVISDYAYESEKDVCFYNLALDRENVTLCKKIRTTDSYSDYTAGKCAAQVASLLDQPATCDLVGASSADCYMELTQINGDPSFCSYIKNSGKKDDCLYYYVSDNYNSITDWSICNSFSSPADMAYCNTEAAYSTQSTSYCDKIGTGSSYYTKGNCYGKIAKSKNTLDLCSSLSQSDKDDCFYYYATTYPYDVELCNSISNDYRKQTCIDYANYSYVW